MKLEIMTNTRNKELTDVRSHAKCLQKIQERKLARKVAQVYVRYLQFILSTIVNMTLR